MGILKEGSGVLRIFLLRGFSRGRDKHAVPLFRSPRLLRHACSGATNLSHAMARQAIRQSNHGKCSILVRLLCFRSAHGRCHVLLRLVQKKQPLIDLISNVIPGINSIMLTFL